MNFSNFNLSNPSKLKLIKLKNYIELEISIAHD